MKKLMIIIFAAICMGAVFSCNKENDTVDDEALTRGGAMVNDSSSNGGVSVTVNDEWAGDTTVHF